MIRTAWPEILGQEKFMDLAFLNSLTRNPNMPPLDPWMSGRTINYYYWGYLLAAAATKLAGAATAITYNLSVATFAGYSFVAAACLGMRLSGGRLAAGIAAAAATVFAGNVAGGIDGWNYFLGRGFEYFHASRVIDPGNTINEFPFFTFFQADLHPHLLAFPFFIAAFAVGHRFLVRESADLPAAIAGFPGFLSHPILRIKRETPTLLLVFVGGTAIAANAWTLPGIGILFVAVCVLRKTRGQSLPSLRDLVVGSATSLFLMLVAYEMWWSYERSYSLTMGDPKAHGLARATLTSPLFEFLAVWGIFFAAGLVAVWPRPSGVDEEQRRHHDLLLAGVFSISLLAWFALHSPAFFPILVFLLFAARIGRGALVESHGGDKTFAVFLLLLGLSMIAGCEVIYFKDSYGDRLQRMNTIFKFYNQAWPLLAIPVAVLADRTWRDLERPVPRRAFALLLIVCAVVAVLYPAAATAQRLRQHEGPVTLDARFALARRNPADAAAIAWLAKNAKPGSTVMEATGDPYGEYARISSHTGIPTVLGWGNHEGLWRGNDPEINQRFQLVRAFYSANRPEIALKILQEAKITYVVVGDLELRTYPNAGLIAESPFLAPAYPGATVFQLIALP